MESREADGEEAGPGLPARFLPGEGELGELRHRQNIKVRAISDTGKEPLQHQHEPGEQGAAQGHGTKELLLATRALERLGFKGASPARVTPKCEERAAFACLLLEAGGFSWLCRFVPFILPLNPSPPGRDHVLDGIPTELHEPGLDNGCAFRDPYCTNNLFSLSHSSIPKENRFHQHRIPGIYFCYAELHQDEAKK